MALYQNNRNALNKFGLLLAALASNSKSDLIKLLCILPLLWTR